MQGRFLNIALAIVRGRSTDAREMIRSSPAFTSCDTSILGKLQSALEEREERAVNRILHHPLSKSLSLDMPETSGRRADYLAGVKAVEDLIEQYITNAEPAESTRLPELA